MSSLNPMHTKSAAKVTTTLSRWSMLEKGVIGHSKRQDTSYLPTSIQFANAEVGT